MKPYRSKSEFSSEEMGCKILLCVQMNAPADPFAEQGAAIEAHAPGPASGNLGWTLLPALLPTAVHHAFEGTWLTNITFVIL